jgi:hypothetical protein
MLHPRLTYLLARASGHSINPSKLYITQDIALLLTPIQYYDNSKNKKNKTRPQGFKNDQSSISNQADGSSSLGPERWKLPSGRTHKFHKPTNLQSHNHQVPTTGKSSFLSWFGGKISRIDHPRLGPASPAQPSCSEFLIHSHCE